VLFLELKYISFVLGRDVIYFKGDIALKISTELTQIGDYSSFKLF
jgi:DUF2075 family protein